MVQTRWVQDCSISPDPVNDYHMYSSAAELWTKSEPSIPRHCRPGQSGTVHEDFPRSWERRQCDMRSDVSLEFDSAKDTFTDLAPWRNSESQP